MVVTQTLMPETLIKIGTDWVRLKKCTSYKCLLGVVVLVMASIAAVCLKVQAVGSVFLNAIPERETCSLQH